MKKIEKCDFCGSKKFRTLFFGKDNKYDSAQEFSLVKCKRCGLVFINPQPTFKELKKHYPPSKYYSFNKINPKNSLKTKFKLLLYDTYFNPNKDNLIGKFLFLPFIPYIRGTIIKPNSKILDIGSGSGQFLYEMRHFGMYVQGVEPGGFNKRDSKKHGLEIKNTDLISAKYPKNYFDIVTINHVLEHVPEPSKILKEIHRILKKDGKLIIGVPNYRSLAYWIFGRKWYQLDIPRHLNDFSSKVLAKKVGEVGFKVDKIRHNSKPHQFSISMKYFLGIENNYFVKAMNILFLPLAYIVNALKIGDQIEIYCSK